MAEKNTEQAPVKKSADEVTVVMVGGSRGAHDGDERTVSKATAERLVEQHLARYKK